MKKIIVYRTANMTPCLDWDYVAHFEGECEGLENQDRHGYGSSPELALKDFMEEAGIENCYYCGEDFEFDDNKSCYLGDDSLGQKMTVCDECANDKGYS